MSEFFPQKTDNFNKILSTIQNAKEKAYAQVNSTLVELYWIFTKVKQKSWGKGVVKELAEFIKDKEPNTKGFTARNMWMMKQFYETYSDNPKLHTLCTILFKMMYAFPSRTMGTSRIKLRES